MTEKTLAETKEEAEKDFASAFGIVGRAIAAGFCSGSFLSALAYIMEWHGGRDSIAWFGLGSAGMGLTLLLVKLFR